MSRTDTERLRDILTAMDAIDRAEALAARQPDDADLADAVLSAAQFHVFTIGKAVKALSADLTGGHPEVPWSDIARDGRPAGAASGVPRGRHRCLTRP